MKELRWAMVAFRVAMGVTFLSPVADRFGLWGPPGAPNVSWGNWDRFVAYSTTLNWYLPDALQHHVAALATAGELIFGIALIAGIYTRLAAYGAAGLLACFALAMATGLGIRAPLDYSVFVDAAGAWLLAAALSYDRRVTVAELARPEYRDRLDPTSPGT
jgi:putative oxidoreductase